MSDKKLSADDQSYVDLLDKVANDLTVKILTPEYAHFVDMWKAVLGGFICRERAKYIAVSSEDQAVIDTYTPDKIRLLGSGKIEVREVEKIVEKKVVEKVYVDKPVVVDHGVTTGGAGGNTSGVMRYKPAGVQKEKNKKRELVAEERLIIIEAFNKEQRLVDKDNPICTNLIQQFPASNPPSYPAQVAGYWSFLCRIVTGDSKNLIEWHGRAIASGSLPQGCPMPKASPSFQGVILENMAQQKALDTHRKKFTNHMSSGPTSQPARTATPASIM
jgi:hypothetical protein